MIASMCYYGSTGCKISRRSLATLKNDADTTSAITWRLFCVQDPSLGMGAEMPQGMAGRIAPVSLTLCPSPFLLEL
jgi:hypothetical protein